MLRFFPLLLIVACDADLSDDAYAPDLDAAAQDVEDALVATDPEPLIAMLSGPNLGQNGDCPMVETIDTTDGMRQTWTGGCLQEDGTYIGGQLERFEGNGNVWISGEQFSVFQHGQQTMYLDGAIEMSGTGGLWLIDATATTCGNNSWACSDGHVSLDLAFTVFATDGYPHEYDVTVSGVVAPESGSILVDGAWSVDSTTCGVEPTEGMIAIVRGAHQSLQMDGARQCDACADWILQGRDAPAYCATSL